MNKSKSRSDWNWFTRGLVVVVFAGIVFALVRPGGTEATSTYVLIFVLLIVGLLITGVIAFFSSAPLCRVCLLPMSSRSEWLNYPTSKMESGYAQRDCLAALNAGAWEDATKLFTILGTVYRGNFEERQRLNLAFYECSVCNEQAVRLISFTSTSAPAWPEEQTWVQHPQYMEVRAGEGATGYLSTFEGRPGDLRIWCGWPK
jgi:hypothetical protein